MAVLSCHFAWLTGGCYGVLYELGAVGAALGPGLRRIDRALDGFPNWIGFFDRGSSYRVLAAGGTSKWMADGSRVASRRGGTVCSVVGWTGGCRSGGWRHCYLWISGS